MMLTNEGLFIDEKGKTECKVTGSYVRARNLASRRRLEREGRVSSPLSHEEQKKTVLEERHSRRGKELHNKQKSGKSRRAERRNV